MQHYSSLQDIYVGFIAGTSKADILNQLEALSRGDPIVSGSGALCLTIVMTETDTLPQRLLAARQALLDDQCNRDGIYFSATPWGSQALAFLFPGQGAQRLHMLRELYENDHGFRALLDTTQQEAFQATGTDTRALINAEDSPESQARLNDTANTQPCLGVVEAALADWLHTLGVVPAYVMGHSYGELPALYAAGMIGKYLLARLSAIRGQLMAAAGERAPGGMVAVKADLNRTQTLVADLADPVFIANINGPRQTVVGGKASALAALISHCQTQHIACVPLRTSCAFHTPLMAPIAEDWRQVLEGFRREHLIQAAPAPVAVLANATGQPYPGDPDESVRLLVTQLTQPVDWHTQFSNAIAQGARIFVEVGPGNTLAKLAKQIHAADDIVVLTCEGAPNIRLHWAHNLARLLSQGIRLQRQGFIPVVGAETLARLAAKATVPVVATVSSTAQGFFDSNQRALEAFFAQQNQWAATLVNALTPTDIRALHENVIAANQTVLQAFLKAQTAVLETGVAPSNPASYEWRTDAISEAVSPAPSPQKQSLEKWLISAIGNLTGFPTDLITPEADFESQLGLDSITKIELWSNLLNDFPALNEVSTAIGNLHCIRDICGLYETTTTTLPPPEGMTAKAELAALLMKEVAALTGYDAQHLSLEADLQSGLGLDSITILELWRNVSKARPDLTVLTRDIRNAKTLADLVDATALAQPPSTLVVTPDTGVSGDRQDKCQAFATQLKARIAEHLGMAPEQISEHAKFHTELGIDIFTRDEFIDELLRDFPEARVLGQELLNAPTLGVLRKVLQGIVMEEKEPVVVENTATVERFVLEESWLFQNTALGVLPSRLLVIGQPGQHLDDFMRVVTKCNIQSTIIHLSSEGWHVPGKRETFALDDIASLSGVLVTLSEGNGFPATVFLALSAKDHVDMDDLQGWTDDIERAGVGLFALAKAAYPLVKQNEGRATLGVLAGWKGSPAWAGACGVAKSLAQEWPDARIRSVHLEEEISAMPAASLIKALTWGPSDHDVILTAEGKLKCHQLVRKPLAVPVAQAGDSAITLHKEAVILIVGGASGISAEVAVALARNYGCHIVAIGRTPFPEQYPYPEIDSDSRLKKKIVEDASADAAVSVNVVKETFQRIKRQREILATQARIEKAGGTFHYFEGDAADITSLTHAVRQAKQLTGQIDAVIHGAGAISDCLIEHKTVEDFRRIFYAKAVSVFTLAHVLRNNPLKFVFLFSSLASYVGTPGQTDYVAANEILNESARYLNGRVSYPVKSLLWSVWTETGLVSTAFKKHMETLNVHGISNEQGTDLLLREMLAGNKHEDWVLFSPVSTLRYTLRGSSKDFVSC